MLQFAAACVILLPALAQAVEPEFVIERISGPAETALIGRVSSSGVTLPGVKQRTIPLDDLVSFRRSDAARPALPSPSWVLTTAGDRLACQLVEANDDQLALRWSEVISREPLRLPLEKIRALVFQMPTSSAGVRKLERRLATDRTAGDVVWLTTEDEVAGELAGFNQREVTLNRPQQALHIGRDKITAVRFDPALAADIRPRGTRWLLMFADGTQLFASDFQADKDQLRVTPLVGGAWTIQRDALVSGQIFHERVQPLSEREPVEVRDTPYLGRHGPWVKDGNVLHGPMRIGDRDYAVGLGVRSRSEISYDVEPQDREFRADVGVDYAADGGGNVVFEVLLDGTSVWRSANLTGEHDAVSIPPVPLRGAKRLTLLVDFGEQGDVADYADWGDAIILRER